MEKDKDKGILLKKQDMIKCLYVNYTQEVIAMGGEQTKKLFNPIYEEIAEEFGYEVALKIYQLYKGMQITFPTRLFNPEYVKQQIPIPTDEMCKLYDSFGLTALHYALILRKNDVVEKLLKSRKWTCYDFFDNESGINRFLDYKFLAKLLCMPCVNSIITSTTDIIEAQLKTIKSYKFQIKLKEGLVFLNKQALTNLNAKKREANKQRLYDKLEEIEEEIYRIKDIIKQRNEEILELNNDIEEIYIEIENIISTYNSNLDSKISSLKQSKNKFIVFLLSLFENPDYLLQAISTKEENSKYYNYLGFEFTTYSNLDIDLDEEIEDDTSCSESEGIDDAIKSLYGDSWFSPNAHKDIKVLSAEYRKLAKEYHPDICKNINASKVFVDIANERAEIIESIK